MPCFQISYLSTLLFLINIALQIRLWGNDITLTIQQSQIRDTCELYSETSVMNL